MSVANFQGIPAPISVLMFLASGLAGVSALLLAAGCLLAGRRRLAAGVAGVAGAGAAIYLALLFGSALVSRAELLPAGGEKYFCEIDCHLAYSVAAVSRPEHLGTDSAPVAPTGGWLVVRLKTRFDERTISPRRGDAPLRANPRAVAIVDEQGRRFPESETGRRALEAAGERGTPLDEPLRPGESYWTSLVFDIPPDAKNPRLLLTEADPLTGFLIGHENSPAHRKAFFRLDG